MFVETFHLAHNHHVENTNIILKVKITQATHTCLVVVVLRFSTGIECFSALVVLALCKDTQYFNV